MNPDRPVGGPQVAAGGQRNVDLRTAVGGRVDVGEREQGSGMSCPNGGRCARAGLAVGGAPGLELQLGQAVFECRVLGQVEDQPVGFRAGRGQVHAQRAQEAPFPILSVLGRVKHYRLQRSIGGEFLETELVLVDRFDGIGLAIREAGDRVREFRHKSEGERTDRRSGLDLITGGLMLQLDRLVMVGGTNRKFVNHVLGSIIQALDPLDDRPAQPGLNPLVLKQFLNCLVVRRRANGRQPFALWQIRIRILGVN